MYSPELGRWLSRDPIGEIGGLNLYVFCSNNATNLFDVLGLADNPSPPDPVTEATDKALNDYLTGVPSVYSFNASHPWTIRFKNHPHMKIARENIKKSLQRYCSTKDVKYMYGDDNFNLNDLSWLETAKWLGSDILSWLSDGHQGHDRAFVFGSFRLHWIAYNLECSGNCFIKSGIDFTASDKLHLRSMVRIPKTNMALGLPDEPFGKGKRFNNVLLNWEWSEEISR
jgi:hypothetical protein